MGGPSRNEGRVEVFYARQWGTICDRGWDLTDARILCRMLAYTGAVTTPKYGMGSGRIWLSDVSCQGNENSIFRCKHAGWGNTGSCDHSSDVGVKCYWALKGQYHEDFARIWPHWKANSHINIYENLKILVIFLFRHHTNSVKPLLSVFGHGWPRWKWITTWKRSAKDFKFCACIMSYRKHGFWVLMERCFKQTAMKYVNYSIKLSPYRQFCCPLSLTSALSSANIPVSPRFFGEFDMLTFTARHSQFFSFPVLRSQLETLLKPP